MKTYEVQKRVLAVGVYSDAMPGEHVWESKADFRELDDAVAYIDIARRDCRISQYRILETVTTVVWMPHLFLLASGRHARRR